MKPTVARVATLGLFIVAISGCGRTGASAQLSPALAVVRADSEVFEAVVRLSLTGNGKDYPFKLTHLRVDERPNGEASGFRSVAGMSQGVQTPMDSTLTTAALESIVATRTRILRTVGVPQGRPFNYPTCGGTLAPPPPPGSTGGGYHATCPKESQEYVVVQTPTYGVPSFFNEVKGRQHAPLVDVSGELWTVIVSTAAVGARGQSWDQHAWVFKRDPVDRQLKLVSTLLLAIEE
jgi:hypothetical protein